jgi:hypothetical protein
MEIRKVSTGEVLNTLVKTHVTKWNGWMLCVDEWQNSEHLSGGPFETPFQAFYVHGSVWNADMHYDDANRWDLDEDHPLRKKLGVIEADDYWLVTGTESPSINQLTEALKQHLGPDGWIIIQPGGNTSELPTTPAPTQREHILTVRVDWSTFDALKVAARQQGTTVSDVVRTAIQKSVHGVTA